MSAQDDLDQKRDAIIERIKQVFPKNPPGKGNKNFKVTKGRSTYEEKKLIGGFEGKRWEEMLSVPGIVYEMSEIDFTRMMSDKAYFYFFPAFLIATLNEPSAWIFTTGPFEKIYNLLPQFSVNELDLLIAYFEFQIEYRVKYMGARFQIESLENMLLHLLFRRDELAKDKAD